jgi:hypothetical protein
MDPMRFRLRIYLVTFVGVMVLGTFGFMMVEGISLYDAFYFSIVTIATVGYGDIHPATAGGKVLAILLIVMGVGTFLGVVANATETMLNRRERQVRLKKLNMVIGVFFSEVGTRLIVYFSGCDPNIDSFKKGLIVSGKWSDQDFLKVSEELKAYGYTVDVHAEALSNLRGFLSDRRAFLLRLLENPVLLEHESFTEVLRAVFHLAEELAHRRDLSGLPDSDKRHLSGDIKRAYGLLVHQWLDYMKYLKEHYPYLFSLAMRTNPFDESASAVVR